MNSLHQSVVPKLNYREKIIFKKKWRFKRLTFPPLKWNPALYTPLNARRFIPLVEKTQFLQPVGERCSSEIAHCVSGHVHCPE